MIQKNGWEADFKKYLSTALVKFFVDGIESGKEYAWDCTADSEESVRKSLEKDGSQEPMTKVTGLCLTGSGFTNE